MAVAVQSPWIVTLSKMFLVILAGFEMAELLHFSQRMGANACGKGLIIT